MAAVIDGINVLTSGAIVTTSGTVGVNVVNPGTSSALKIYSAYATLQTGSVDLSLLQWSGATPVVIGQVYNMNAGGTYALFPGRPQFIMGDTGIPLQVKQNGNGSMAINVVYNVVD